MQNFSRISYTLERFSPSCSGPISRMPASIASRLLKGRFYRAAFGFVSAICKAMKTVLPAAFPVVLALLCTSGKLWAQSADALIEVGDLFYAKLQAQQALKYYLPAEKLEPNNVRLLVHISREYRHLMSDATSTADKVRLGSVAVDYAKRASALAPKDPEAQLAVAISYGKLQPFEGNRQKFEAVHIIKDAADKAIDLDPRNDLAWHVLGRWYKGLVEVDSAHRMLAQAAFGGLPTATYEEAATCFEKAIELNPNRLMHYIALGGVYAKMGRKGEARTLITKGLAMPNTEKDDPDTKLEGEQLLAKLH
jgi:tetratricopeptide (TPR) repeat protein